MLEWKGEVSAYVANRLDLRYWSVFDGCLLLALYRHTYAEREVEYLAEEIERHKGRTLEKAFNLMHAHAKELDKAPGPYCYQGAFLEFMRIYQLAASYFDISKPVTPYKFISWAISRRTIHVQEDLIRWREGERAKPPTGRTSAMREELKEAQERITELEAELATCREQLEEARRADSSGMEGRGPYTEEDFPEEYEDHGIFTMVAKLIYGREPVLEIMRLLNDEKEFLSQRENGYFFHPKPEGKKASTLRNYIKNRLKKV